MFFAEMAPYFLFKPTINTNLRFVVVMHGNEINIKNHQIYVALRMFLRKADVAIFVIATESCRCRNGKKFKMRMTYPLGQLSISHIF